MKLTKIQQPTWPSLGRLADLREEIDRFFESPLNGLSRATQFLGEWAPVLDVYEDKENFVVKAELPGMKREDIDVSLHEGSLIISGERKSETRTEESQTHHTERFYGRFQRSVSLPTTIATDRVKADYKDGILTITLPKTEEAKPKKIDVSVS
ncbi:MAG TPA: Hsp20/alpha crystallin family protein [Verrucomicrobiae bacterium]|nr:Hsp20/alpha crystallin family protein [Verrucomicrobiae bacterium]